MTTIARKVLNANDSDNMVFTRLVDQSRYQEFFPIGKDMNFEKEECAYVFEDGSALINNSYNDWRIVTNYGTSVYFMDYDLK